jgi:uncharacterized cupredoxin-like copper-binding protein
MNEYQRKGTQMKPGSRSAALALGLVTAWMSAPTAAYAHGNQHQSKAAAEISTEEHAFGRQGDPGRARRTIEVDMRDTMRFEPGTITVKQGETVRFVVRNSGAAMHEMVLGPMEELKKHGELMKKHPGMEHDEPYMAHVAPGKKEELVWQFTRAGDFWYGCLVPGHFDSGMVGRIKVLPR